MKSHHEALEPSLQGQVRKESYPLLFDDEARLMVLLTSRTERPCVFPSLLENCSWCTQEQTFQGEAQTSRDFVQLHTVPASHDPSRRSYAVASQRNSE